MVTPVNVEQVKDFLASMPPIYRGAFTAEEVAEHARVALERRDSTVHVGRCPLLDRPAQLCLCVVADDRPGLLATIAAAFLLNDLDVVRGDAYTRCTAGGMPQALDLFWVRDLIHHGPDCLGSGRLARLRFTLSVLMKERIEIGSLVKLPEPRGSGHDARVRFVSGRDGGLAVLEVEAGDRAGLLLLLARTLAAERVNISRAEVRTEHGRALDRFVVNELDGQPISVARRLKIQVSVLSAVQLSRAKPAPALALGASSPPSPHGRRKASAQPT